MGSHDFDPVAPPVYKQQPEIIEPKKGHGCFFYGCITALILFVLVLIAIGVAAYLAYSTFNKYVNEYTDTVPVKLPVVTRTDDEMKDLHKRLDEFKAAMESGKASELVLTADDINAWIDEQEEYRGIAYFSIEGDKITGKISIPLSKLKFPLLAGRYLNGTGTFRASIKNARPVLNADSIEVKGKAVSEDFMKQIRDKNLLEDAVNDPDSRKRFENVESLEVKDGKIIIKSRAKDKDSPDGETKPADDAKEKKADDKADDKTPPAEGEKPATKDKPEESKPADAKPPVDAPKPVEEAPKPLAA